MATDRPKATFPGLVIFDCDGILVDSERLAVRTELAVGAEHGLHMERQDFIDRYMGRSAGLFVADLQDHLGRSWTEAEHAEHDAHIRGVFERELEAVPGVADAIDQIHTKICVASSSYPESLRWKLRHCGLLDRFADDLFSGHQVEHGKPAPDLFLFAAEQMGFAPSDCVVVEDSEHGVNAARAAGMHVFIYFTGMVPRERLQGPNCTFFDDMRELPALITAYAAASLSDPSERT